MRYITTLLLLLFTAAFISSCEKTPEKQPPIASFTISPSTGSILTNFTFNGSKSYDETDPITSLMVRWDFEGDGTWDTDFNVEKIITRQYNTPGTYSIVMELLNTDGWTDIETKNLEVYADSVPPTASFIVNPDTSSTGTIFYFSAGSSHDQYTPVEELRFRWDWQSDGIWDTPFINDSIRYHKYEVEGSYRILMEVKNNIHMSDTISRKILVYEP